VRHHAEEAVLPLAFALKLRYELALGWFD